MKNKLLFIILFVGVWNTPASYAQNTFAPVGAEWWYGGSCYNYDNWCEQGINWRKWADNMQAVKDTVVAGEPSRMLVATRYYNNYSIAMRDTFFVYNNDDTVFVYDKIIAGFTPLYIFNVAVGDTVCLRQPNTKLTATDPIGPEFCIIIDSIKQETYGTEQLTSYYNHTLDTAQFNQLTINWGVSKWMGGGVGLNRYRNAGKYTTKIGGNWPEAGSFFPEVSLQNPDYYKKISLPTGTFRCYKDAVTDIKALPEACDFITSIADLRQSEYQISVSPNPSNGIFTLTAQKPLKEALSIQVTDLSGRTMHTTALPAGKTELTGDLSALSPGIYVLLLQTGDQRYYQKLVISR